MDGFLPAFQIGHLAATVEGPRRESPACQVEHGGGKITHPKEFPGDVAFGQATGGVGDEAGVESVVKASPLGKRKLASLPGAGQEDGFCRESGIIEVGADRSHQGIEVAHFGEVGRKGPPELGGVDPIGGPPARYFLAISSPE